VFGDIFLHLLEILLSLTQHFSGLIILLLVVVEVVVEIHLVHHFLVVVEGALVVLYLPFILPQQPQLQFQKHILGALDILLRLESNILLVLELILLVLGQEGMHQLLEMIQQ
jgi:hypothetical protein